MRAPVYRNLDQPFQILGFNAAELTFFCFLLVLGNEVAQLLSIHPVWVFFSTLMIALTLFWIRRSLGDMFLSRLIRFIRLPSQTNNPRALWKESK